MVLASNAAQGPSPGPSPGVRSEAIHAGLAALQRQLQEAEEALDVVRRSPPRHRGPLRGPRQSREVASRQTLHAPAAAPGPAPARSSSGGKSMLDETAMFASHPGLVFGALGAPLQAPKKNVEEDGAADGGDEEQGVDGGVETYTSQEQPVSTTIPPVLSTTMAAAAKPSGAKPRGKKGKANKAARGGRAKQQQYKQQGEEEEQQQGVAKTLTMRPVNESVNPPPPPAIVTAAVPCLPVVMHQVGWWFCV